MTALVRDDGVSFVVGAQRQQFTITKKSQVVDKLQQLVAKKDYICLFNKERNQYEVAHSLDQGYLLAESIWYYFNQPQQLIYCERVSGCSDVLLVVIRRAGVYIDKQLSPINLQSALLPLADEDLSYRIVTTGDVPLRRAESFGTFRLPQKLVASFEVLETSLLEQLPALESLQLRPMTLVLKKIAAVSRFSVLAVVAVALLFVIGGWWLAAGRKQTALSRSTLSYSKSLLASPASDQQIKELITVISQFYLLPGWRATKIVYHHHRYYIHLLSEGGTAQFLQHWSQRHHYQFQLRQRGVVLMQASQRPAKLRTRSIYTLEQAMIKLVDQLTPLFPRQVLRFGAIRRHDNVRQVEVTIQMTAISPNLLDLVRRRLSGMPVTVTLASIDLDRGTISGIIKLTVWEI